MSSVNVYVEEARVTAVNAFRSRNGDGLDVFIEAESSNCTVYLQVVLYDDKARSMKDRIHRDDLVIVNGTLKDKPYKKPDGTAGHSLVIEKPVYFRKIFGGNRSTQLPLQQQQETPDSGASDSDRQMIEPAVTSSAETATDEWDDSEFLAAAEADYQMKLEAAKKKKQESDNRSEQVIPQADPANPYAPKTIMIDGKLFETYDQTGGSDEDDLPF